MPQAHPSYRRKSLLPSAEDQVLGRLADGLNLSQDEYDQVAGDLPPELIAKALLQRFRWTEDVRTLVEAARLYLQAGDYYQAFEVATRIPRSYTLRQMAKNILPRIRRDYPQDAMIARLFADVLLVIDLRTGRVERFPGLLPAREGLESSVV